MTDSHPQPNWPNTQSCWTWLWTSLAGQNQRRWPQGQQGQVAWSEEGSPAESLVGRQKPCPALASRVLRYTQPSPLLGLDGGIMVWDKGSTFFLCRCLRTIILLRTSIQMKSYVSTWVNPSREWSCGGWGAVCWVFPLPGIAQKAPQRVQSGEGPGCRAESAWSHRLGLESWPCLHWAVWLWAS